jgi:nucleotide-binding universal stress UspA family protein
MCAASARPIIVGVDGSPASVAGLDKAAQIALATATRLIVVHVRHVPNTAFFALASGEIADITDGCQEEALRVAQETLSRYELDWSYEVREGEPGRELIEAAKAHDAEVILVGAARHAAVSGTLVGSVSGYLLHHAPQSVAVVRPQRERSPDGQPS